MFLSRFQKMTKLGYTLPVYIFFRLERRHAFCRLGLQYTIIPISQVKVYLKFTIISAFFCSFRIENLLEL